MLPWSMAWRVPCRDHLGAFAMCLLGHVVRQAALLCEHVGDESRPLWVPYDIVLKVLGCLCSEDFYSVDALRVASLPDAAADTLSSF